MKPPEVSHFRGLQALAQFRQRILYFRRHFGIDLAQQTESMLRNQPEWEVVTPMQLAIVKFCYATQGAHTPAAGRTISRRMMEEGFACVLTIQLKGRTVLRICLIHPETTEDDIRHTIQRMYQYARALKKERVSNFS